MFILNFYLCVCACALVPIRTRSHCHSMHAEVRGQLAGLVPGIDLTQLHRLSSRHLNLLSYLAGSRICFILFHFAETGSYKEQYVAEDSLKLQILLPSCFKCW